MKQHVYNTGHLDRLDCFRHDPDWLKQQLQHDQTRLLLVWRNKHLFSPPHTPRSFQATTTPELIALADELVMLGSDNTGRCWLALDLSSVDEPLQIEALRNQGEFIDLRTITPLIDPEMAALLAYARGMFYWHQQHRFCGHCGSSTLTSHAGHLRTCSHTQCRKPHYPRTDPAVIMLIHDDDHCLLGRQPTWPPGMHSILAGYVEPGESLEAAVTREVAEEVGISVSHIHYHSSQPWPFPGAIMLGFYAHAEKQALTVNTSELESARWFHRSELMQSTDSAQFHLPRRDSIARALIEQWLQRTD